jgi:hypothetical protein
MDPQTQQQDVPPHSNKKVIFYALAAAGATILLLVISALSVGSGDKNTPQNTLAPKSNETESSESVDPVKTEADAIDPTPADGWKVHKGPQYSINYPPDWKIQILSFPNGDLGTSIQPVELVPSEPSVLIVSTNSTPRVTQQKQNVYIDLGFKRSNVVIDNTQAVKLTGSIKSASASASTPAVTAAHIYLTKGQTEYLLKYSYMGRGVDQTLESLFEKMISSFRLN